MKAKTVGSREKGKTSLSLHSSGNTRTSTVNLPSIAKSRAGPGVFDCQHLGLFKQF